VCASIYAPWLNTCTQQRATVCGPRYGVVLAWYSARGMHSSLVLHDARDLQSVQFVMNLKKSLVLETAQGSYPISRK